MKKCIFLDNTFYKTKIDHGKQIDYGLQYFSEKKVKNEIRMLCNSNLLPYEYSLVILKQCQQKQAAFLKNYKKV